MKIILASLCSLAFVSSIVSAVHWSAVSKNQSAAQVFGVVWVLLWLLISLCSWWAALTK